MSAVSPVVKIEFQGGESLLNFEILEYIVTEAEARNQGRKRIDFVIATNLLALEDYQISFLTENCVDCSISLDGPASIHDQNRPGDLGNRELLCRNIERIREKTDRIAALMTTTRRSLAASKEIIDEYIRLGFPSVFLRPINPYGHAREMPSQCEYEIDEWLDFYKRALDYIIELNMRDDIFIEEYAALLLRRILTPFPTGFVDLQSPAGLGVAGMVIDYDGSIYLSDESRMLGAMGDNTFMVGDVNEDSFHEVMADEVLGRAVDRAGRVRILFGMPVQ